MDLTKIKESEGIEYWREESLMWWRMYFRNLNMIKNLREENRRLRLLLSDYVR